MRRLVTFGALLFCVTTARMHAQVIEKPVAFDNAGLLTVVTPSIADRAGLRPPTWPVSGEFSEARLFTTDDMSFILTVTRQSGVVERYNLSAADRDAIRASVSLLPREMLSPRNDARNAFIRNQTLLGLGVYGPAFAGAIGDNAGAATAGYLVVAGGTFFAASELSRRMFISRAQNDLSTNTGLNGALTGAGLVYILHGGNNSQWAGAFVGGLGGTALGLAAGRGMTESEAVGAGFGSDVGALIAFGVAEAGKGESPSSSFCTYPPSLPPGVPSCRDRTYRGEVATIIAAGLIGYPLGFLYPRNAMYNVTPGDIQTLWTTAVLGGLAGAALLPESPKRRTAFTVVTAGGILGIVAGDRFLVRRLDHSRTDAARLSLGTTAGMLMGAGVAALVDKDFRNPRTVFALATAGGIAGLIATEHYISPGADAGRGRIQLGFNPASIPMLLSRAPGNYPLFNVRF